MAMPHRCGYSFLKCVTPGKGCARRSPTEVQLPHSRKKTSFFVCGSDPSWALGGGNSSSAEVRATSASYSAGGIPDSKDMPCGQNGGPDDLLWGLM